MLMKNVFWISLSVYSLITALIVIMSFTSKSIEKPDNQVSKTIVK